MTLAASPGSSESKKSTESGREVVIFPEAEKAMREWGITFEGSEVRGPSDFVNANYFGKLEAKTAKRFDGICLTQAAQSVEISYDGRENIESIFFVITNDDGWSEGFSFQKDPSNRYAVKQYMLSALENSAKGYKEGRCEALVS